MANIPEISVAPQVLAEVGRFTLSNALLSNFIVIAILTFVLVRFKTRMKLIPGRFQVFMEGVILFFYGNLVDAYGSEERAKKYLPLIVGIFLFLLIANQFTMIPFVQSIVVDGSTSFFRNPTSHLALPLALALVVFFVSHIVAFTTSPLRHIGNFFKLHLFLKVRSIKDFLNAMLENFLSLLDIIGELAKVVSLACRLFGNVFAGEVMVMVIAGLSIYTQFFIPMPFYALSIFSGLIQALVFAILAMAFITGMAKSVEN